MMKAHKIGVVAGGLALIVGVVTASVLAQDRGDTRSKMRSPEYNKHGKNTERLSSALAEVVAEAAARVSSRLADDVSLGRLKPATAGRVKTGQW